MISEKTARNQRSNADSGPNTIRYPGATTVLVPKNTDAPTGKRTRHEKKPDRVEQVIYGVVLFVATAVPLLTFAFSFGNVGLHGVSLGVDYRIAYLTGPAVDLSVTGLIAAASYLSHCGRTERELWPLHLMSALCATAMLYLNCGQAVYEHQWRLAVFDAVGPMLLAGWGFIGPWLFRQIADARAGTVADETGTVPVGRPGTMPRVPRERPAPAASRPAGTPATVLAAERDAAPGTETPPVETIPEPAIAANGTEPPVLAARAAAQLKIVKELVQEHGPEVTLPTIMARTGCSKSTASRRRADAVAEIKAEAQAKRDAAGEPGEDPERDGEVA